MSYQNDAMFVVKCLVLKKGANKSGLNKCTGPNKIYGCEVRRRHHLERKNGGGYDNDEYEEHPERYVSTFAQKVCLSYNC
jgi:hypothetical protein